jgi:predicted anti-sigma-YlaC factor YlaD
MICRDYERLWNERLDARAAGAAAERALEEHAANCAACRAIALRYQALRQAIQALPPSPAPSAKVLARVLEGWEEPQARRTIARVHRSGWLVGRAVAAALIVVSVLTMRIMLREPTRPETPGPPARPARPLADALADATSATWALAEAASAPAARLGRDVIAAAVPEAPSVSPWTDPVGPATNVLEQVGGQVNAGIRPLSGSAQHAFGFLLGPTPGDTTPSDHPGSGI